VASSSKFNETKEVGGVAGDGPNEDNVDVGKCDDLDDGGGEDGSKDGSNEGIAVNEGKTDNGRTTNIVGSLECALEGENETERT
jgi:hypothetical protein